MYKLETLEYMIKDLEDYLELLQYLGDSIEYIEYDVELIDIY